MRDQWWACQGSGRSRQSSTTRSSSNSSRLFLSIVPLSRSKRSRQQLRSKEASRPSLPTPAQRPPNDESRSVPSSPLPHRAITTRQALSAPIARRIPSLALPPIYLDHPPTSLVLPSTRQPARIRLIAFSRQCRPLPLLLQPSRSRSRARRATPLSPRPPPPVLDLPRPSDPASPLSTSPSRPLQPLTRRRRPFNIAPVKLHSLRRPPSPLLLFLLPSPPLRLPPPTPTRQRKALSGDNSQSSGAAITATREQRLSQPPPRRDSISFRAPRPGRGRPSRSVAVGAPLEGLSSEGLATRRRATPSRPLRPARQQLPSVVD